MSPLIVRRTTFSARSQSGGPGRIGQGTKTDKNVGSPLPVEIRRLVDPCLAADFADRNPGLALLDDERLLCVRELRCPHRLRSSQPGSRLPETPSRNDPVLGEQSRKNRRRAQGGFSPRASGDRLFFSKCGDGQRPKPAQSKKPAESA